MSPSAKVAPTRAQRERRAPQPDILTRETTIHLHKYIHGVAFKRRAPRAIKTIKAFAERMMKTRDVRIDPTVNKSVWEKGVRNVATRIRVRFARKRNEDEEAKEKFYTLVTLVKVSTFKGLQTELVDA